MQIIVVFHLWFSVIGYIFSKFKTIKLFYKYSFQTCGKEESTKIEVVSEASTEIWSLGFKKTYLFFKVVLTWTVICPLSQNHYYWPLSLILKLCDLDTNLPWKITLLVCEISSPTQKKKKGKATNKKRNNNKNPPKKKNPTKNPS